MGADNHPTVPIVTDDRERCVRCNKYLWSKWNYCPRCGKKKKEDIITF